MHIDPARLRRWMSGRDAEQIEITADSRDAVGPLTAVRRRAKRAVLDTNWLRPDSRCSNEHARRRPFYRARSGSARSGSLRRLVVISLLTFLTGCGTSTASSGHTALPAVAPLPVGGSVFLIVLENRSFGEAMTGRFTASLATRSAVATNYHAVGHPSLPNYLALAAGDTFGIADDGYHALPPGGIGDQLSRQGIS